MDGSPASDLGVTAIYVTHDQIEVMTLTYQVAIMNKGVVQQIARPREIYVRLLVANLIVSMPQSR